MFDKKVSIWAAGLALFSMFFGAGNLIFPLLIGKAAGSESVAAVTGLGLSAVVFPFLGLVAMMLYGGDLRAFLARLGKWPAFAVMGLLYMSQGPVGAMPRHFTLMHASIKPYIPGLPLIVFSALIACVVFYLTIRPTKMMQWLGSVLTPLLLLAIGVLVSVGIWQASALPQNIDGALYHFQQGLKGGYQTLDLTAALLFATLIVPYLGQGNVSKQEARRRMLGASLIAAGLLMAAYVGLCYLSAHHSGSFALLPPEELLHAIAVKLLGPVGGFFATGAVFLACLTTNITLAALFAEYVRREFFQGKGLIAWPLAGTLFVTGLMATLGFSGIMRAMGPVLEVVYPGLIALCLWNMISKLYVLKISPSR
jgi:LIVCS family branched-chain amino acid:cation transporter